MKKAMLRKLYPVAVAADKAVGALTGDTAKFIYAVACCVTMALTVIAGFRVFSEAHTGAIAWNTCATLLCVHGLIFAAAYVGLAVFADEKEEQK